MICLSFCTINNKSIPVLHSREKENNVVFIEGMDDTCERLITSLLKKYKNIIIDKEDDGALKSNYSVGTRHVNHFDGHIHISRSYLSFWQPQLRSLNPNPSITDIISHFPCK